MKFAFLAYSGMTALDLVGMWDPVTRLRTMGFLPDLTWDVCAPAGPVKDVAGLGILPDRIGEPLTGYDMIFVPGGLVVREMIQDAAILDWLRTARDTPCKTSVCTGSVLLGAAGFLRGKRATTHPAAVELLRPYCAEVVAGRVVDEGDTITAGGVTAGIDLGLHVVARLAGAEARERVRRQMDYRA